MTTRAAPNRSPKKFALNKPRKFASVPYVFFGIAADWTNSVVPFATR